MNVRIYLFPFATTQFHQLLKSFLKKTLQTSCLKLYSKLSNERECGLFVYELCAM